MKDRTPQSRQLHLWINGHFVGVWSHEPSVGPMLQYDQAWAESEQGRPLSLSLPFTPGNQPHRGAVVNAFFENLLPDSQDIRERVARRFRTESTDAFSLLKEIGRDCAGALQILPPDTPPDDIQSIQATRLTDDDVATVLRNTVATSLLQRTVSDYDDFRISIAGAQEKTALLWHEGQWCIPHGATPTTHILKLPMGVIGNLNIDMRNSIENEWLCAKILQAYGLPVAHSQIAQFGDIRVLVVERFDRAWRETSEKKQWLVRLPQEDLCQATGTPPHLKYESDGGPGIRTIMNLLTGASHPRRDQSFFFRTQVLFWMLGATDGHAKNFSIFLNPNGGYELTPLYDVLSAYPVIGMGANKLSPFKVKLSMAVRSKNAHWIMKDILRRHWIGLGNEYGITTSDGLGVDAVLDEIVAQTPHVIETVRAQLPESFPEHIADQIFTGLQNAAKRLAG